MTELTPISPCEQVSIYMPSLKVVRNVVERMKNLSHHVVRFGTHVVELWGVYFFCKMGC